MKVYNINNLGASTITSGDLFTIAVNTMEVNGADSYALYVTLKADSTKNLLSNELGGDNQGIKSITPEFYPYATEGAECAAFVTDLSWADNNLNDYEYVVTDNGSTKSGYLVFGVLNSSKTQFNDPFEAKGGFEKGACWNADVVTNFRG
jgi:hypothetical protein